jgi:putative ABC transport system substrate-binding protein
MRRREFIGLLSGAVVSWRLAARAQQVPIPRVGYIWIGSKDPGYAGLRQGLTDRGYIIGKTLAFEERYAEGRAERLPALISELLTLNVNVLVTPSTMTTRAAQRATSTVPIVSLSGDPVRTGLVANLSHPGGNVTGLSLLSGEYNLKWLELLKEAVPTARRAAVLWNPDNLPIAGVIESMRKAAPVIGLELITISAGQTEIDDHLSEITNANLDGLVVSDDAFLATRAPRLFALAAERRVPAIYPFSDSVMQGGLMAYSANFFDIWRQAAGYVDRILKGARPAHLSVGQATNFTLRVNLKTARAIGLTIPPPIMVRADEIE